MSNYLTTDGLKKFSLLPEVPRLEARGICHICHIVNLALIRSYNVGKDPSVIDVTIASFVETTDYVTDLQYI